jgi:pyruvate/2-oxoglutarate dehydrogenase complex dihydrolipoamide acyltransferase (E2) component
MATEHPLPKWGVTMEEGTIGEWCVGVGDVVTEGQVLVLVETDKIEVELESPASGLIAALLAQDGDNVAVGSPIVVIATDATDLETYLSGQSDE